MKQESILGRARREGAEEATSQWAQCSSDEARERGRREAEEYAPRRITWWLFGLLCGVSLSAFIWSVWL